MRKKQLYASLLTICTVCFIAGSTSTLRVEALTTITPGPDGVEVANDCIFGDGEESPCGSGVEQEKDVEVTDGAGNTVTLDSGVVCAKKRWFPIDQGCNDKSKKEARKACGKKLEDHWNEQNPDDPLCPGCTSPATGCDPEDQTGKISVSGLTEGKDNIKCKPTEDTDGDGDPDAYKLTYKCTACE